MHKVQHLEPSRPWLGYILLPYGEFYKPTKEIAKAKPGDTIRFFQGSEHIIERVMKIPQDDMCDMLCRIIYGIPWKVAFKKWQSYAVLEGNDKGVISPDYCLWVIYGDIQPERQLFREDSSPVGGIAPL